MERKLASIQKIIALEAIEGADKIELATVNGWKVIVAKDVGHQVGDLIIYCEIDSFLPVRPEFEFLRKSSYKHMGELEGFRIKTMKMRGVLSQGLILPIDSLVKANLGDYVIGFQDEQWKIIPIGESDEHLPIVNVEEGLDVTSYLGIVKYEIPEVQCKGCGIPGSKSRGTFPFFVPKTDEERIQNFPWILKVNQARRFVVTEKLHGTSATYYLNEGKFGVASRNFEIPQFDADGNQDPSVYWKIALQENIEQKMRDSVADASEESPWKDFALQGEIIGEGINKNYYKIQGHKIHFFSGYLINAHRYMTPDELLYTLAVLGFESVPVLDDDFHLPETVQEMLDYAEAPSVYSAQPVREGVVVRSVDEPRISFKAISNKYLLKEE